ncbi:MAG: immunity 26/phosphotriesterase HocA family protein [Clostridia bacterium]|nr:immunity 26/phosphotriesterase HocA family protein [Clostridia bacterium]
MATFDWNKMFGEDNYFKIKNSERKYLGLEEIDENWEKSYLYSKTNWWYKRTTLFWKGNDILKIIYETNSADEEGIYCRSYLEYDTKIKTDNREKVLPLTSRGKPKNLTSTNVMAQPSVGCCFSVTINNYLQPDTYGEFRIYKGNYKLNIGETDKINNIHTDVDFRNFIEYYVSTCPDDYFEKLDKIKYGAKYNKNYKIGDVFRVEYDRFNYAYGIIIGDVRKIAKWNEMPYEHLYSRTMYINILVRFYGIVTTDKNLKVEDLKGIPLRNATSCADSDIYYGMCEIIDHKELDENDVDIGMRFFLQQPRDDGGYYRTDGFYKDTISKLNGKKFKLLFDWGTIRKEIPYVLIPKKILEFLKTYHSSMGTTTRIDLHSQAREIPEEIRAEVMRLVNLPDDATYDDFAEKYGGLTRSQILEKIKNGE